MFEVYRKEITWGGRLLTLETGKIARQADGAVMVTYGGTQVLATACFSTKEKPGALYEITFFPVISSNDLIEISKSFLKKLLSWR